MRDNEIHRTIVNLIKPSVTDKKCNHSFPQRAYEISYRVWLSQLICAECKNYMSYYESGRQGEASYPDFISLILKGL